MAVAGTHPSAPAATASRTSVRESSWLTTTTAASGTSARTCTIAWIVALGPSEIETDDENVRTVAPDVAYEPVQVFGLCHNHEVLDTVEQHPQSAAHEGALVGEDDGDRQSGRNVRG